MNGVNDGNIVVSGDSRGKKADAPKEKKIEKDKRSTTPYMTKYERARVLGTRALQIRYVQECRDVRREKRRLVLRRK